MGQFQQVDLQVRDLFLTRHSGTLCRAVQHNFHSHYGERVGFAAAQLENEVGLVNKVSYFDGATVLYTNYLINASTEHTGSAFTIGSFINGPSKMQATPNDAIFQHEYGRYLQSQAEGPAYLTFTAIPDLLRSGNDKPTAWDGNARALEYFAKYYGGLKSPQNPNGVDWDIDTNFIPGFNKYLSINDPTNQEALKKAKRSPNIFDIFSGVDFLSRFWFLDTILNYNKNK